MKKTLLILAVCLVVVLLAAPAAFAMKAPYTHGNFATNSKGCGDCHVTHSASVQKLLAGSGVSSQTEFCLGCHGRLSPFDVEFGLVLKGANDDPAQPTLAQRFNWGAADPAVANFSYAGGFSYALNFKLSGQGTALEDVTSVHNVKGIEDTVGTINGVTTYEYVYGDTIPGGTQSLDFECGSCHDPHAGGAYADDQADKNPRLLKENILGRTGMRVKMKFNQDENLPVSYTSGINNWCGSCHDIFDTSAVASLSGESNRRSGYYLTNGDGVTRNKYMHLFGVNVNTSDYPSDIGQDPYKTEYLGLETDGNNINCLTCHRAHGSAANTSNTWNRYQAYKNYNNSGTTDTGAGSALLRLPERDVCYACHGAAQFNHSVTH